MTTPTRPAGSTTPAAPSVRCYHCLDEFAWDQRTVYSPNTQGTFDKISLDNLTDRVKRDEALLNAYVLCPNKSGDFPIQHYLPLGYVRYLPPVVIGLVGTKDTGKTTLLATIVEKISRGALTKYGFNVRPLVDSMHADFRKNRTEFMKVGEALESTQPASEQVDFSDAFLLTKGNSQRPVAFFDVGGESLGDSGPEVRFIQTVSALIFVVDPDRALGLIKGSRDHLGLPSSEGDRAFNAVLSRLSRPDGNAAQYLPQPAAIVLAKADVLRFEPVVSRWLRQEDPPTERFDPGRVRAESRDLYAYLYQQHATAWLEPFKNFRKCTLHAVSATGGRSIDGGYRRGLRPQRVLDPFVAILAMTGVIDGPDAEQVGR